MLSSDTALYALIYRVLKSHYRTWGSQQYKFVRRGYLRKRRAVGTDKVCDLCHKPMEPSEVSIDHIIPVWILIEYDLPALEYHYSNFQLAHIDCNSRRGNQITKFERLPLRLQRKVLAWQKSGLYMSMGYIPLVRPRTFDNYSGKTRIRALEATF